MPTRIGIIRPTFTDPQGGRKRGGAIREPQTGQISSPWGGYTPDLPSNIAGLADATACQALAPRGGYLQTTPGRTRIDSTRLPLGDTTPPASSADAEAVVGLFEGRNAALDDQRLFAVTADTAANGGGHLYELVSGQWTHRAANGAATQFDSDATDPAQDLVDFTYYSPADIPIFTNNVSPVYQIDSTTYNDFSPATLNPFVAKSCETSEERILFFNTSEGGTRTGDRLRWTTKSASPSLTGRGSGFADFPEMGGQGLRVMNLGRKVVLYFDTGVVTLSRTGRVTDPFTRQSTDYRRGLMGMRAVTSVGRGIHFGIFNDGWYFFTADDQWVEAGVRQQQNGNFHKWKETFYSILNKDARERIICEYDPRHDWVHILFPSTASSGAPDTYWIYDRNFDAVYIEQFGNVTLNVLGFVRETSSTVTTIDSITDSIDSISDSIDSFAAQKGIQQVVHGTTAGLVMKLDDTTVEKDGLTPTWFYRGHRLDQNRPDREKTFKGLVMRYQQITDGTAITLGVNNEKDGAVTNSFTPTDSNPGNPGLGFLQKILSGFSFRWFVAGAGDVRIDKLTATFDTDTNAEVR